MISVAIALVQFAVWVGCLVCVFKFGPTVFGKVYDFFNEPWVITATATWDDSFTSFSLNGRWYAYGPCHMCTRTSVCRLNALSSNLTLCIACEECYADFARQGAREINKIVEGL